MNSWRSNMKKKTCENAHLWDLSPLSESPLSEVDRQLFMIKRVASLLDNDSFCHSGYDNRPETPVSPAHYNH